MRQLVQLNESAERFDELGVEVIAVFREEKAGVAGLRKIVDRQKPLLRCVLTSAPKIQRDTVRAGWSSTTTLLIQQVMS